MVATISDSSRCSVQLRDYVFDKELLVPNIFGQDQNDASEIVGDVCLDKEGFTLFIVNVNGTHLKTYSVYKLRMN